MYELLRDAQALVPELSEVEFVEVSTSLRPGSPGQRAAARDHSDVEGLVVATGHFRNGILLTPVTGDEIAGLVGGRAPADPGIAPFAPGRQRTPRNRVASLHDPRGPA